METERDTRYIYIDCETTGLDPERDEILTFSAVNSRGEVLFDGMFRPERVTEWPEAEKVNGISPADTAGCRPISEYAEKISGILSSAEAVYGWNVGFDISFLAAAGACDRDRVCSHDSMEAFMEMWGEPDVRRPGELRRKRLTDAADILGFEWDGRAHGSLADAQMTRKVDQWVADWEEVAELFAFRLDHIGAMWLPGDGDVAAAAAYLTGALSGDVFPKGFFALDTFAGEILPLSPYMAVRLRMDAAAALAAGEEIAFSEGRTIYEWEKKARRARRQEKSERMKNARALPEELEVPLDREALLDPRSLDSLRRQAIGLWHRREELGWLHTAATPAQMMFLAGTDGHPSSAELGIERGDTFLLRDGDGWASWYVCDPLRCEVVCDRYDTFDAALVASMFDELAREVDDEELWRWDRDRRHARESHSKVK